MLVRQGLARNLEGCTAASEISSAVFSLLDAVSGGSLFLSLRLPDCGAVHLLGYGIVLRDATFVIIQIQLSGVA